MEIEILYEDKIIDQSERKIDELPRFVNIKNFWKYRTEAFMTVEATTEALNKFYEWANENKKGVIVLQITYLDFHR